MNRSLLFLLLAPLVAAPRLLAVRDAPTPPPTEKRIYKQVGGQGLEIWIWKPADWTVADKRSAIVFYHGGGWSAGSPTAFARQAEKLAEKGMVAFSAQYRLTSQSGVTVEDCVKDAKSAFRWVRVHATELGVDPAKIAAGGGSAGGHLAAALVTLDAVNDAQDDSRISSRPAALVLFNPAVRLDSPRVIEASAIRAPEARAALSPYEHVKRGHPPTIVFHGEADTSVPIQSVRDYAGKVTQLGGTCQVVAFEGQRHSFFNREPFVWDTLNQAIAFLQQQKLLRQAVTIQLARE